MINTFDTKEKVLVKELIEKDGFEHTTSKFADIISEKLKHKNLAQQFILEEIEAASQGNDFAVKFVKNSGFTPSDYKGAMKNSRPEIDGADGPQQFLLTLSLQLQSDVDMMIKFRTKVVDKVMKNFLLGKYKPLEV